MATGRPRSLPTYGRFTATGAIHRHDFLCLGPGDQFLGGATQRGLSRVPAVSLSPLRHYTQFTASLLEQHMELGPYSVCSLLGQLCKT